MHVYHRSQLRIAVREYFNKAMSMLLAEAYFKRTSQKIPEILQ